MAIKVGDTAPDFNLTAQNGENISLGDFRGQKSVVLYFYPKDDTPGCTVESCAFRDQYEVFQAAGAEVIGVSGDSRDSHQKFANKYNLPFTLLSDQGDRVRKQYGATTAFGFIPGRVTYVIDQNGVVQYVFDSMLNFKGHVEEALKTLQQLAAK
ncbi:peroxiredoxin [Dolichospermum sp. ST_con]|nr:peroxiredoxin [Dolichospermum sp. ST_con]MDD1420744.1 peroxiredoxin [Dolichospermum sp. ST_sed1]MDD1426315.1 peroxiredoxin [Dolichospermum sp. ST_sed9]MDD1433378.1 peroxiredoxin [Dolichospermum sp. ST_sed6]MDD1442276.1 peroxiredoxin [Dolichospermum sp. ST_sed3]MDD1447893.1 peroxiredoxin [Dolichospermum sp. ST_sed8]MDD1456372.1 peroxiredoxin [Dolichospermum sp. ST_sed7]MDD1461893.1 peroxiredoxin [Dolichospermum sp. ST_sed2]MDD1467704.1 peroxiredoxin [Dolichospermum sp. ST_sed5]MDD1473183